MFVLIALCLGACSSGAERQSSEPVVPRQPDIVFILMDDMRADAVDQLPELSARTDLARFDRSYVELPQCCPARATFLTGRYSSHTGVDTLITGAELDDRTTLATMLRDGGYRTGLFGKYLNGFPFGRQEYVPPGWDEFHAYEGAVNYHDYRLNTNGPPVVYGSSPEDYSTDVLTGLAINFMRKTPDDEPFFAYIAYNAPHLDADGSVVPREGDRGSCAAMPPLRLPSYDVRDTVGEPPWMAALTPMGPLKQERNDTLVRDTCESLRSADASITSIFEELERQGRLEDTYVVFSSDNGFSWGEHRLCCKGHLYEESVRVPLLARGPEVEPGEVHRLTSNIDLAPTLLEWAGVTPPSDFVDGTSFAADLRGEDGVPQPEAVLLRGCRSARPAAGSAVGDEGGGAPCGGHFDDMPSNWGLRTDRHKYIEYPDGYVQLFDLEEDPYELHNLGLAPETEALRAQLHEQLLELQSGS